MKTPASIMVVSILGIIYAAFILLALPINLLLLFHPLRPDPIMDQLHADTGYMAVTATSYVITFCLSVLLLAGSIGSLKLKRWGRTGMNVFACGHIAVTVVGTLVAIFYTGPKVVAASESSPLAPAMKWIATFGPVCGAFFSFAIAGVILFFFNRKLAVDAFNGIFPAKGTDFPVEFNETPPGIS